MNDLDGAFAPSPSGGAAESLAGEDGEDAWRPILPVPDDGAQLTTTVINRFAPAGHAFTDGWRYNDADGRLLGCVVRYDRTGSDGRSAKQIRPFTFCAGPDGQRQWRCKGFCEPRPLYGLDRLAARPKAPVLVVEGEKTAEAASIRFPDHVVTTSPSGSNAARKADWSPLAGRNVVIWPDADTPGKRYADDVVDMLRGVGAASVRLVRVPERFPDGWDLADALPQDIGDDDLTAILAEAPATADDAALPLYPPLPRPERYPIEALGPVLAEAALSICRKVQVPEAIAAQSVLAAAALAAQAHANVLLPYGQIRPLSLFFVTVAGSGDRKSSADNEALWPIRKREQALKEEYERDYHTWSIDHAAWSAEKRKIEGSRKLDLEGRKAELLELGPEPAGPLHPFLTAPDPTVEGLVKAWVSAPASLGVFTAEGGQFIGGHGMSLDNRLKTAATFSHIWDGQPIKRLRAMDGVTILDGRRLSMHLMVQPDAAAQFLSDPILRNQGLLSRFLVASPESIAGTRFYKETESADERGIRAYGARILAMLEAALPLADGRSGELEPRALVIDQEAAAEWRCFHDHVESQCGPGRELAGIPDFAAKAAEHAARIAGVLTLVEDMRAPTIGTDAMASAITLVDWYVTETLRLQSAARVDPGLRRAQQLLDWMQGRDSEVVEFRDILRLGPNAVRTKAAADAAIGTLVAHGWLAETSDRPRRLRLLAR